MAVIFCFGEVKDGPNRPHCPWCFCLFSFGLANLISKDPSLTNCYFEILMIIDIICFVWAFNFLFSTIVMKCLSCFLAFIWNKKVPLGVDHLFFWGRGGWFWKIYIPACKYTKSPTLARFRTRNTILEGGRRGYSVSKWVPLEILCPISRIKGNKIPATVKRTKKQSSYKETRNNYWQWHNQQRQIHVCVLELIITTPIIYMYYYTHQNHCGALWKSPVPWSIGKTNC